MRGARSYSPIPKIKKRKKCELELRWEGEGRGMRKLGGESATRLGESFVSPP